MRSTAWATHRLSRRLLALAGHVSPAMALVAPDLVPVFVLLGWTVVPICRSLCWPSLAKHDNASLLAHSRDLPHTLLVPPPPLCCSEAPPPVLPLPCAADRPSYMTARAHKQVCGITLSPCGWSTPANIFSYRAFALRRTSSFIEATCMCTTDTPTTHRPVRTVTDAPVH